MRWVDVLLSTAWPFAARRCSISPATSPGEPGEGDRALDIRVVVEDFQASNTLRHIRPQPPVGRFVEALARRAVGGDNLRNPEPRVGFQQLDEPLAHVAGGAKNRDGDAFV